MCPAGAISEVGREIGVIEEGAAENVRFVQGRLNIGEAKSPPLIRQVKKKLPEDGLAIVDAPPGASCPVIETVKGSFGLNDLKLAVEMLRAIALPFVVVVNRADVGDEAVEEFCANESIDVITRIPNDRRIAEAYSMGQLAAQALPGYAELFSSLLGDVAG